ncbi:porin [Methylomarinum sp. Ch1-1]|uniref:Porin n=1 Tax=Methylomarinum roseum TaxID=3067653 RepID=A0AAU7NYN0_9GAMM|nr:porin [Methylomarinum sp. Ch1-1]MDP4521821.1 porin [Methylomarinum sp. Ch1-1]
MAINKTAKMLALGAATTLGSMTAQAADKELLDMLLQNGAINQSQYNKLIQQETLSKSDVDNIKIKLGKKGLQVESGDGDFKFGFGGRIHADATFHSNDKAAGDKGVGGATDGTEIRRGRLAFKGLFWDDFKFVSEVDFADNKTAVKDMFITYQGLDWLELTVGHQKQPISMELQESSNDIMFTERSLVNSLTASLFDRAIGIHLKSSGDDWSAQIGAYGDAMSPEKDHTVDEGWGAASRLTYAPINKKDQVLHLGAYGGYRAPDTQGGAMSNGKDHVEFSYETTHMSNVKTSKLKVFDAKDFKMAGFEAAYMQGPFSVQGEYGRVWADLENGETLDLDAFYVQTAWTLTGESRSYKGSDGEFKRLKPSQNFSLKNGGWGAVELAARYDQNDLNSDGHDGGSEKAVTVALNWYLNENLRLMADYRHAFDLSSSPAEVAGEDIEDVHAFTFRTQLAF